MGLFTKAWEERSLKKALAYVEKCKKQDVLTRIAREGYLNEARLAAVNKLMYQEVLCSIAMDRGPVGDAAFERITEPRLLLRLAVESQTEEKGKRALEKISDNALLIQAARTACVSAVRGKAVSRLEDPAVLAEIARKDKSAEVRERAVGGLKDQEVLKEIARGDRSVSVRRAALERIDDHEARYAIAREDENEVIRAEAFSAMGDQESLAQLVRSAKTTDARKKAVEHLKDQKTLEEAARSDPSADIRRLARGKIRDPRVKAELVFQEGSEEERLQAARELPLSDRELKKIVLEEESEAVAMAAVRAITDHRQLLDTAHKSSREPVIGYVVETLSEREELEALAGRPAAAEKAIGRMQKLGLLDENEKEMSELELLEHFFREGLCRNGKGSVLEAYNDWDFDALEKEASEESVRAALLLLRKDPISIDSYYSTPVPSATAYHAGTLLRRLYSSKPELRGLIRKANNYSVREHLDHGAPSCHDDEGPLIFDFR